SFGWPRTVFCSSELCGDSAMPVQFTCDRCHRVLSTARRKTGAYTHCPGCRAIVWITPRQPALVANAADFEDSIVKLELSDPCEAPALPAPAGLPAPRLGTGEERPSGWWSVVGAVVVLAAGVALLMVLCWNGTREAPISDVPPPSWDELQHMSARHPQGKVGAFAGGTAVAVMTIPL